MTDNDLIWDYLPMDDSAQSHSLKEARKILASLPRPITLVDLGCGTGTSYEALGGDLDWIGLDIAESPEVNSRTRSDLKFLTYDGSNIPLASESVDVVYSHQVLEHVHHPFELLASVHRVLKPSGVFVGSTSHLEPYHSRSHWNFTPYGLVRLLVEAGFVDIEVRPGIDALTLITRRLASAIRARGFSLSDIFSPFFMHESPLNAGIELLLRMSRVEARRRNAAKLLFCGHFTFSCKR